MKRLMLLMGTETYRATDFLSAANRLGVEVVVGLDCPTPAEVLAPGSSIQLDFLAREASTELIAGVHRTRPLNAVVAVDDGATALAARAGKVLGLGENSEEAVMATGDKSVFREIMSAAGLKSPWFKTFPLDCDPALAAGEVPYPCVLKPLFLNASRGVIRADDPDAFVAAFRRIAGILSDEELRRQGGEAARKVLVESFMPGMEVALEGLVHQGEFGLLAFFDKPDPLDGPYFEETLFITPSRHSPKAQERSLEVVRAGVRALGLRTGPVHAELRLDGDDPYLLELAPRSIGGHCSRILRFGTGWTLEELILRQALGRPLEDTRREDSAAGVMMIPIPARGRLRGVRGLEEAKSVEGVIDVEISIPLSQAVVPVPEGHRYLGFIFAKGGSPQGVESSLRWAHQCLSFEISP